jgi:long-subunit acyl-CoA synthetase (AMP-forming)
LFGTNSRALARIELRIAGFPDPAIGEVLVGGSGPCAGYLNDPEATERLFTVETHTWIRTGDIDRFDEHNSLVVLDRRPSIFKLAQGQCAAGDIHPALLRPRQRDPCSPRRAEMCHWPGR